MSRYYNKSMPYCNLNGVDVIPVVKMTNVTYNSSIDPVTPGRYALLMIKEASGSPSVAQINSLLFPYYDEGGSANEFGVENLLDVGILSGIDISSSSQLIVVGEYNEAVNISSAGEVLIDMEAGFAEEYFV